MKTQIIKSGFQQLTTDYTDLVRPLTVDRRLSTVSISVISVIRGMILNFLSTSLVLACLLSFLPAVAFSGDPPQQPVNNESRFEATASRLNLSAEQKEKINALRKSQRQQMQALLQQMKAKKEQIRNALNSADASREGIAPLASDLKEIHAKMIDLRINNIFAIKEMLGSDQLGKLQQFRQKRGDAKNDRRQFWLEKRRGLRENNEEKNRSGNSPGNTKGMQP